MIAAVREVIAASVAAGSSVRRAGSRSANTGVAPAIAIASPENAADNGDVITSSPGPIPSARRTSASASVPLPTPTACVVPHATANSRSNASSSGPRMNQPRSITRWSASRTAASSGPGVSAMNGTRTVMTRGSFGRLDVPREVLAVVRQRAAEALAQVDGRRPAGRARELRGVRVERSDVDPALLVGPRHELRRSASGRRRAGSSPDRDARSARVPPTLNASPLVASDAPARRNASDTSSTYTKSRICDPSP